MRFIYSKTFIRVFVGFLLVAGFVIFDNLGYLGVIKGAFFKVHGNVSNVFVHGTTRVKDFVETIVIVKNLARENAELNQKIDELSFENARLKVAQQENITLRQALKLDNDNTYNVIAAEVKLLDTTGFARTIVINKGEVSGLRLGQAVVVAPGILVGKITRTYRDTSEVTLITDPSLIINGEVVDSGARGLVRGEHGLGMIFDLITQNEVIKSGDLISTSGLGNDFPQGLLVGEIVGIQSSSSELFQKAFVSPAAELRALRFVLVIQ